VKCGGALKADDGEGRLALMPYNSRMTVREATNLIRTAAANPTGQKWADLGAGAGIFTRALAELIGESGRIIAIDHDANSIRELEVISRDSRAPHIEVIRGDVMKLNTIDALHDIQLDGALLANVLHFVRDPADVLAQVRKYLRPNGCIVVIEYEQRAASR
jgi:ubiquinone/menaquinone biosynthesis C-methylase UbiE